jgi:response regulator RpfG family c-di-GMP phosphodiesterase
MPTEPSWSLKVLVAEDSRDSLEVYCEFLTAQLFRVCGTDRSVASIELAKAFRPDVIVVEASSLRPEASPFLQAIRAEPGLTEIPILVLTPRGERALRAELPKEAEVTVTALCSPEDLVDAIRKAAALRAASK